MFPRPSNVMTAQDYYNAERHCIVVVARDPFPRKMVVSVPEITKGGTIATQAHYVNADFYEVAEMFGPVMSSNSVLTFFFLHGVAFCLYSLCSCYYTQLGVSLSIICPMQHPIFGVIFNMVKVHLSNH